MAALASRGRVLSAETVGRQLGGLEGLPSDLAADALLRTYSLAPDGTPLPGFEPDRTSRGVIVNVLRQSRSSVTYVFVAALIGLVPAIAVPLLMRLFVDRYIVAQDTTWGLAVVLGLLMAAIMAAAVIAMQSAACKQLRIRLNRTGSTAFAWSMLTMRIPNLQRYGTGELIGRLNAAQLYALQAYLLPQTLVNSLMVVVFLVVISVLDPFMGLAALAIVVVVQLISRSLLLRRNLLIRHFDAERIRLSGYTSDVISSAESIKAAAWEQFAFARWAAVREHMSASRTRLGIASQYTTLVPVLAQTVGLGAFLAIGVAQVFAGTVSLGTVVAAQALMVALLTSAAMITHLGVLMQSIASAESQFGPVIREPLDPEMLSVSGHRGSRSRFMPVVALPSSGRVGVARPPSRNSLPASCAHGRAMSLSTAHPAWPSLATDAPATSPTFRRRPRSSPARFATTSRCGTTPSPMRLWAGRRATPASKT